MSSAADKPSESRTRQDSRHFVGNDRQAAFGQSLLEHPSMSEGLTPTRPASGLPGVSPDQALSTWLFRISVSVGLAGMLFGMAMGLTRNFLLAPAHSHFLLLGYVGLFLSALYYRTIPAAAKDPLATIQAVVSVIAAILFPIGIVCVRLGDRSRFLPVLAAGWLSVLAGMVLFVVVVYRTSGAPASGPNAAD